MSTSNFRTVKAGGVDLHFKTETIQKNGTRITNKDVNTLEWWSRWNWLLYGKKYLKRTKTYCFYYSCSVKECGAAARVYSTQGSNDFYEDGYDSVVVISQHCHDPPVVENSFTCKNGKSTCQRARRRLIQAQEEQERERDNEMNLKAVSNHYNNLNKGTPNPTHPISAQHQQQAGNLNTRLGLLTTHQNLVFTSPKLEVASPMTPTIPQPISSLINNPAKFPSQSFTVQFTPEFASQQERKSATCNYPSTTPAGIATTTLFNANQLTTVTTNPNLNDYNNILAENYNHKSWATLNNNDDNSNNYNAGGYKQVKQEQTTLRSEYLSPVGTNLNSGYYNNNPMPSLTDSYGVNSSVDDQFYYCSNNNNNMSGNVKQEPESTSPLTSSPASIDELDQNFLSQQIDVDLVTDTFGSLFLPTPINNTTNSIFNPNSQILPTPPPTTLPTQMKTIAEYEQGFLQLFNLDSTPSLPSTSSSTTTSTTTTTTTTLKSSSSSPTSSPKLPPSKSSPTSTSSSSPHSSPILESYSDPLNSSSTPYLNLTSSTNSDVRTEHQGSMCYSCGNTRINVNCSTRRCQPCCAKGQKPCRLTAHAEAKSRLYPCKFTEEVKEVIKSNTRLEMSYGDSETEIELENVKWAEGHEGFMFVGRTEGEERGKKYRVDRIVRVGGRGRKGEEREEGELGNKRKRGV